MTDHAYEGNYMVRHDAQYGASWLTVLISFICMVRHDSQYGESWRTVLKTDFFLTFMLDIRFDVMFMLNIVYAIFLTIKN